MGVDALDRDAGLARIDVAADRAAVGRVVQVGVGLDNHAGVPAEFEHHAFLASLVFQHPAHRGAAKQGWRSEEHTSELQSLAYLVCRLLLEKKKTERRGAHRRQGVRAV